MVIELTVEVAVGSGAGRTEETLHVGSWAMEVSEWKTYPRACMRGFFGTLPNIEKIFDEAENTTLCFQRNSFQRNSLTYSEHGTIFIPGPSSWKK